ncbi:hypothetical protein NM688_g6839 [Phlebia brevispora]|uniref:Uncharacterized protein n=1 Tax=Phlebia brevispora TaxID=194682 RepID=A0ACC1SBW1_9APHY|nr:hypothetical protein NM688_g6839 [Phlebia brevispora]
MTSDSAQDSIDFIRPQLRSSWQRARREVDVPTNEPRKRALAQFQYFGPQTSSEAKSPGDILFDATFSEPLLDFPCDHDAKLTFIIDKCTIDPDPKRLKNLGAPNKPKLQKLQIAYRMPFYRHKATSKDSQLSPPPFKNIVRLTILHLDKAEFMGFGVKVQVAAEVENALKFYLSQYLGVLHQANVGIFYDLPHDDSVTVDYTPRTSASNDEATVHSVSVTDINDYILRQWQKCVQSSTPKDMLSICLAEISSRSLPSNAVEYYFFARFGPPKVEWLCPHEIVICFQVDDIAWFDHISHAALAFYSPRAVYHKWILAFVITTVEESVQNGHRIKAVFEKTRSSASFSRRGENPKDSMEIHYFSVFEKFLKENYFGILAKYSFDIIYTSGDDRKENAGSGLPTYKPGVAPSEEAIIAWTKKIQEAKTYGYDEITAISEEFINVTYESLWGDGGADNLLATDLFTDVFARESQQQQFWIPQTSGRDRSGEKESYKIEDSCTFAFEVDMNVADEKALGLDKTWQQRSQEKGLWKRYGDPSSGYVARHLYLDFRNSTYIEELSSVSGFGKGREFLARMRATIYAIQDYLTTLAQAGYNIIYSLATWNTSMGRASYLATDVHYQIVTKETITRETARTSRTTYESPVILVITMMDSRPRPATTLPWHDLWVIWSQKFKVCGTVYVSQDGLLKQHFLSLLEQTNRSVTLVPEFIGKIGDTWTVDVTTWERHARLKNEHSPWSALTQGQIEGGIRYGWDYEQSVKQRRTSPDSEIMESELFCVTSNNVIVPTAYRADVLDITFSGHAGMAVRVKLGAEQWSSQSTASWTSTMRIASGADGLTTRIDNQINPVPKSENKGKPPIDIANTHKQYLPTSIDTKNALTSLTKELNDYWATLGLGGCIVSSPMITTTGGLIMQLRSRSESSNPTLSPATPATKVSPSIQADPSSNVALPPYANQNKTARAINDIPPPPGSPAVSPAVYNKTVPDPRMPARLPDPRGSTNSFPRSETPTRATTAVNENGQPGRGSVSSPSPELVRQRKDSAASINSIRRTRRN